MPALTADSPHISAAPDISGPRGLEGFFPVSVVHRYGRNEAIVQGAVRGVHILKSGHARVAIADAGGREAVLALLGPGDFVSELELSGEAAQGLSITALESCEVRHVASRELASRLSENPELALLLTGGIAARVRRAYARIASLAFLDVRARLAQLLVECAGLRNGLLTVEEGSEEMARRIAASREMVSRVLKDMCTHNLVRRQGRRTIILDWEALLADAGQFRGSN